MLTKAIYKVLHCFFARVIKKIIRANIGIWQQWQESLSDVSFINNFSEKKKILKYHQIGSGKIRVLIIGAMHGNEVGTAKLCTKFARLLSSDLVIQKEYTFIIIPVLNVYGFLQAVKYPDYFGGGNIGRFNKNSVDLNRNFPTTSFQSNAEWNHGKNYEDTRSVFAGTKGGSEPETQTLIDLITKTNPNLIIAYHSRGNDVMPSNDNIALSLGQIYAEEIDATLLAHDHWRKLNQTGTFAEWCNEQSYSFLEIETPHRWASDFQRQKKAFLKTLRALKQKDL